MIYEIPVNPNGAREFQFSVNLDGYQVTLSFRWNIVGLYWSWGFSCPELEDEMNGAALVTGINLLGSYAVRELGELWCVDLEGLEQDPNYDGLGTRWVLLYIERGE